MPRRNVYKKSLIAAIDGHILRLACRESYWIWISVFRLCLAAMMELKLLTLLLLQLPTAIFANHNDVGMLANDPGRVQATVHGACSQLTVIIVIIIVFMDYNSVTFVHFYIFNCRLSIWHWQSYK